MRSAEYYALFEQTADDEIKSIEQTLKQGPNSALLYNALRCGYGPAEEIRFLGDSIPTTIENELTTYENLGDFMQSTANSLTRTEPQQTEDHETSKLMEVLGSCSDEKTTKKLGQNFSETEGRLMFASARTLSYALGLAATRLSEADQPYEPHIRAQIAGNAAYNAVRNTHRLTARAFSSSVERFDFRQMITPNDHAIHRPNIQPVFNQPDMVVPDYIHALFREIPEHSQQELAKHIAGKLHEFDSLVALRKWVEHTRAPYIPVPAPFHFLHGKYTGERNPHANILLINVVEPEFIPVQTKLVQKNRKHYIDAMAIVRPQAIGNITLGTMTACIDGRQKTVQTTTEMTGAIAQIYALKYSGTKTRKNKKTRDFETTAAETAQNITREIKPKMSESAQNVLVLT